MAKTLQDEIKSEIELKISEKIDGIMKTYELEEIVKAEFLTEFYSGHLILLLNEHPDLMSVFMQYIQRLIHR